jgi:haloacetate dehalogenase
VLTTSEVLDHPKRVQRLAVLDIVPAYDIWTRMNHVGAMQSYHWPLLPQPAPVPERLIGNDSDFYVRHLLDRWAGRLDTLDTVAVAEHVNQSRNASVVQAVCKDYRAGATVDFDDDQAGVYARRCLTRPVLLLWGRRYLSTKAKSPLEIWKIWANAVTEVALDRGHFIAEEQPEACAKELVRFFAVVKSRAMRV